MNGDDKNLKRLVHLLSGKEHVRYANFVDALKIPAKPGVVGKIEGITCRVVDGNLAKLKYSMDFVEGVNWIVNKYVPDHEVWVDIALGAMNIRAIFVHELSEVFLMQNGYDYELAHSIANDEERDYRLTHS